MDFLVPQRKYTGALREILSRTVAHPNTQALCRTNAPLQLRNGAGRPHEPERKAVFARGLSCILRATIDASSPGWVYKYWCLYCSAAAPRRLRCSVSIFESAPGARISRRTGPKRPDDRFDRYSRLIRDNSSSIALPTMAGRSTGRSTYSR